MRKFFTALVLVGTFLSGCSYETNNTSSYIPSDRENRDSYNSYDTPQPLPEENNGNSYETPQPVIGEWYDGGTLHSATVSQWNVATEANKLATCGDYVASVTGEISKSKAYELKNCIDEAASTTSEGTIPDIGAACVVLLGY